MARQPRRNHSAAFKAHVALAALAGYKTLAELAQKFQVYPTQITDWKRQLEGQAASVFDKGSKTAPEVDLKTLHAYDSVSHPRESIMNYIDWYNHERPHSRLNRQTPHEAYTALLPAVPMAA